MRVCSCARVSVCLMSCMLRMMCDVLLMCFGWATHVREQPPKFTCRCLQRDSRFAGKIGELVVWPANWPNTHARDLLHVVCKRRRATANTFYAKLKWHVRSKNKSLKTRANILGILIWYAFLTDTNESTIFGLNISKTVLTKINLDPNKILNRFYLNKFKTNTMF